MLRSIAVASLLFAVGCGSDTDAPRLSQAGIGLPLSAIQLADLQRQEPIRFRRVWSGAQYNAYASAPSPDGTFVTDIDWDTGDLAVRRFATGTLERVTDKGSWMTSSDFAEGSVVSPDGVRIAYAWVNASAGGYELRTIQLDGSDTQTLIPASTEIRYFDPHDWSRDGRWILTSIFRSDYTTQLALVSATDGAVSVVKQLDWRFPGSGSISPDGRFVAYDLAPDEARFARDVYVVGADGGSETHVVRNAADDVLLGWTPDGSRLLYYSDRTVWQLPMQDGRPTGDAELVRADVWNLIPIGFANDRYLFSVNVALPRTHTAVIDVANGRVVRAPEPVTTAADRVILDGAWSPDGKSLAYLSRPQGQFISLLTIRSLASDDTREFLLHIGQGQYLSWAPDGNGIFVYGASPQDGNGIFSVDLRSGSLRLIVRDPRNEMSEFALHPDGRSVYYRSRDLDDPEDSGPTGRRWIVARDLQSGEVRRIFHQRTKGTAGRIGFSPDGSMVVFAEADWEAREFELRSVAIEGGTAQTVYRFPEGTEPHAIHTCFEWTPDGTSILFAERDPQTATHWLRAVDVDSGDAKTLLTMHDAEITDLIGPQLSPDGRHVAFMAGRTELEIWVMEGF